MVLDLPGGDGSTRREHLELVEAQTGQELIQEPEVPPEGEHVWEWFWELHAARGEAGFGPAPLSYSEIDAWSRLTRTAPRPWEVAALKAMDATALAEMGKAST